MGAALSDFDPKFTGGFSDEQEARDTMAEDAARLAEHQDMLMARETHGLLVLFQGMDAAGKDATIKHVMSAADPQGCEVKMFKEATEKEVRHDYLWRAARALPARVQIGIFNRSYYEQVVTEVALRKLFSSAKVIRVHSAKLCDSHIIFFAQSVSTSTRALPLKARAQDIPDAPCASPAPRPPARGDRRPRPRPAKVSSRVRQVR